MKHISIKDVARELGVAVSTVSRAFNDKYDIKKETRNRILKKAKEMGYHPNPIAMKLQQSKTLNIGVVVPEFRNAFFPDVICGIQDVLIPKGYQVLIMQSNEESERELANVKTLVNNMVDGIIISFSTHTEDSSYYEELESKYFPIVQFNRVLDKLKTSKVVFDDYTWAFFATEHLIHQGYKNIVHLAGPQNFSFSRLRRKGFIDALKKHNLCYGDEQIIPAGITIEDGKHAMQEIINSQNLPEAIFAITDPTAIGAMLVLKENKIKIPDDIGVVGFSESRFSDVIEPSLTTVQQPTYEMGQTAANIILQEIESNIKISQTLTLGGSFKLKKSSVRLASVFNG
jgi:LacI family transcriptional regulator